MAEPSIGRPAPGPILVVGAASRDLDPTDVRGWRLGGTVCYASLTAARLGVPVRALVGADDEASTAAEFDVLRAAGAEVEIVPLQRGPVFENRQAPAGRTQIAHQTCDPLPAAALPIGWRDSATVLLGPVAGEIGSEWAAAFHPDAFVALAWQGRLRELFGGEEIRRAPLSRGPLVERANALFVSAEDVRWSQAVLAELVRSDQALFVTHGGHGAVLLRSKGGRYLPPLPRRAAVDPTGAGDVSIAAWLAARALAPDAKDWQQLAVAAAMASLSVEARTLSELPGRRELCEVFLRLRGSLRG